MAGQKTNQANRINDINNNTNHTDDLTSQLIEAVTDMYLAPPENTADEHGRMYLNLLAEEFSMTPIKVRKILITSGVYQTEIGVRIGKLYESGKSVKEIQALTGLSAASISGYLPYRKTVYNLSETTALAERLRTYRARKAMVAKLQMALRESNMEHIREQLWETIAIFENYSFTTAKGLRFTYMVRGNELFFSRKEKSVTRASVMLALERALLLQREGKEVTGPKNACLLRRKLFVSGFHSAWRHLFCGFQNAMTGPFFGELLANGVMKCYNTSEKACLQGLFHAVFQQTAVICVQQITRAEAMQKFIFASRVML